MTENCLLFKITDQWTIIKAKFLMKSTGGYKNKSKKDRLLVNMPNGK